MVVGGLIGLPSLPEATRWLNSRLSQLQCPEACCGMTYMKSSSFQGLMFVKFKNVDDRDLAVGILRSAGLTSDDGKVMGNTRFTDPNQSKENVFTEFAVAIG